MLSVHFVFYLVSARYNSTFCVTTSTYGVYTEDKSVENYKALCIRFNAVKSFNS